jgi:DNA-binding Xre family transcriptional regulator
LWLEARESANSRGFRCFQFKELERIAFHKHHYHKPSVMLIIRVPCTMSAYYFVHCVLGAACYSSLMIIFRLDKLLRKRGWSAYRLAQVSGIHPSVLSKYVNNQVREISLETLDALCRTLACKAGDLIENVAESRSTKHS